MKGMHHLSRRISVAIFLAVMFLAYGLRTPQPVSSASTAALTSSIATPESHTFAPFNTGVITGGGATVNQMLDTSAFPAADYYFFRVTADFSSGANPAYSSTIRLWLNNGGGTDYVEEARARRGALESGAATALIWSGVLKTAYTGGGNLVVSVRDIYTDGSGPYTSTLENVTVTIYPTTANAHTFPAFNTGTITGGGAAVHQTLDTSSLPVDDYVFFSVTADFESGADPAYSHTLRLWFNDGGASNYTAEMGAHYGALNSGAATTLRWTGAFDSSYVGGDTLRVSIRDFFDDENGTYTSNLQNVTVSLYPAPPDHTFASFNTGEIVGAGAAVSQSLDTGPLPAAEYFYYTVTADFESGPNPAYSSTSQLWFHDGAGTKYTPEMKADSGALESGAATTLAWYGAFNHNYVGGDDLTVSIKDMYTDGGGPYTSSLENVTVRIFAAETPGLIQVSDSCAGATELCYTDLSEAARDVIAGGTLDIVGTPSAEDLVINQDLILDSSAGGTLAGAGGAATISITAGSVTLQNLSIQAATSTHAIAVSGGGVTIRGNNIDGNGAAAIAHSGGTATAYANNIIDTGGFGISGTVSAPKNWWGAADEAGRPSGVSPADWSSRLGADIIDVAFGSGTAAVLGNAQLAGPGPGVGVIISFGRGTANAPFGVGVTPYSGQSCSDYYDFYSTSGAGWTVILPIDTGTAGCTENALNARKAYLISDVTACAASDDPDCWTEIPQNQITINGSTLEITGLSLAGTHLVAGDSSGGSDPTAVALQGAFAGAPRGYQILNLIVVSILASLTGAFLMLRRRDNPA